MTTPVTTLEIVDDGDTHTVRATSDAKPVQNAVESVENEAEWEQFQAFVAQVEQREEENEDGRDNATDDAVARDAEQALENMEYVDRYRQVLQRAADHDATKVRGSGKRAAPSDDDVATQRPPDDVASIVRSAATASSKRRKPQPRQEEEDGESSDDSLGDLCDWRSKAI